MTNEISIEIDGKTITGSYEVKRGTITVSDRTGSQSAHSAAMPPRNFWPAGY
jgi:phage protein D